MKPLLYTKRFTLIPYDFSPNHNEHLRQMMQSEDVQKYIRGHAYSGEEVAESFVKIKQSSTAQFGMWLIFKDHECAGMCLLKALPTEEDLEHYETGYWLKPAFWGMGIAGEVATRMVKYAFDELNLACVVGVTHQDNIASQKSLEKAGLTRQGNINAYEQDLPFFKIDNPNHTKSTQPTLQTKRFRLIPWRNHAAHNAQFTKLLKSEQVQKYIHGKPHTDAEITDGLIMMAARTNIQRGFGNWLIYKDDECVGLIFLKSDPNPDEPLPYEIGYWLFPEFWGQAIAAEVADKIVSYAFEQLNLPNIIGITEVENIASQKSLLTIGFTRIEDFDDEGNKIPQFKITNPHHKKSNKPALYTKRLKLLPWVDCPEFTHHMTEMMQDESVQKYVYEHILSADEMAAQLTRMSQICAQPDLGYWMIYQADSCVGMALLKPAKNAKDEYWAEVGYWLKPTHWGKAIAAEASTSLVKYGFEVVKLDAINAVTHPDNMGSQKSLLNAGLTRKGNRNALDARLPSHNQTFPYFEIRASDYQA